ncbi:UvrD-helicase domain-containing protein [Chitinibacter sp. S2-10]|uniref:UvrD-helicase domain-containing protein n=1 Tax=Chitinibacter sp. S2-10 TaxID=3373597 RepID=UPI003977C845
MTTFTNKAAEELKARLAIHGVFNVQIATLHSTASKILIENKCPVEFLGYDKLISCAEKVASPCYQVLVDEAQDLDGDQWKLIQKLGKTIFAVGDVRQSIYGWRGADSKQFTAFVDSCQHDLLGESGLILMTTNRRSCAAIVELSNRIAYQATPSVALKCGGSVTTKQCVSEAVEHEQIIAFVKRHPDKSLVLTRNNDERLQLKKQLWIHGLVEQADVMTIHAAKCAERENVVLRCGKRKFGEIDGAETVNEWYVRVTRAKTNLLITAVGGLPAAISQALEK